MTLETIVNDPSRLFSNHDVDEILSKISEYEKIHRCDAGIIEIQRRQFGSSYEIVSSAEAKQLLKRSVNQNTPEWGHKYYPKSYFESLRKALYQRL
ncbi:MAG: hypothetical protein AABX52_01690 [Nanoarchaeota archaeon]